MTPASGFRTARPGRSGSLRLEPAHSAGVADGYAMRVRAGPDGPMSPASGFRAAGAGCSGSLRLGPAQSEGVADGYARVRAWPASLMTSASGFRAAGPGDVTAPGRPCGSGEIEDGRSGP